MFRRIAVVGSREGVSRRAVREFIDKLGPGTVVVSGGARGVDSWAVERAEQRGLRTVVIRPNWKKYGRSAGFRRNKEIVLAADEVVAFTTGSNGTANTMKHALNLRRNLLVLGPEGELIAFKEALQPGEGPATDIPTTGKRRPGRGRR